MARLVLGSILGCGDTDPRSFLTTLSMRKIFFVLPVLFLTSCSVHKSIWRAYKNEAYADILRICQAKDEAADPRCQYALGTLYYYGQGVKKDRASAAEWFAKAASGNFKYAQMKLGELYFNGDGVDKDGTKAIDYWGKAAGNGLPEADYRLYIYHSSTKGDAVLAEKWLWKAAEAGSVSAQVTLGTKLCEDPKAPSCSTNGISWLKEAATTRNLQAERSLGNTYFRRGDYKKALPLLLIAANNGDTQSQFLSGIIYMLQEDLHESYKWLWLARAGQYPPADLTLSQLESGMKPEEIKKDKLEAQKAGSRIKAGIKIRKDCSQQEAAFLGE